MYIFIIVDTIEKKVSHGKALSCAYFLFWLNFSGTSWSRISGRDLMTLHLYRNCFFTCSGRLSKFRDRSEPYECRLDRSEIIELRPSNSIVNKAVSMIRSRWITLVTSSRESDQTATDPSTQANTTAQWQYPIKKVVNLGELADIIKSFKETADQEDTVPNGQLTFEFEGRNSMISDLSSLHSYGSERSLNLDNLPEQVKKQFR
jgi:hypothetical protein